MMDGLSLGAPWTHAMLPFCSVQRGSRVQGMEHAPRAASISSLALMHPELALLGEFVSTQTCQHRRVNMTARGIPHS